jgi:hypothetical protein
VWVRFPPPVFRIRDIRRWRLRNKSRRASGSPYLVAGVPPCPRPVTRPEVSGRARTVSISSCVVQRWRDGTHFKVRNASWSPGKAGSGPRSSSHVPRKPNRMKLHRHTRPNQGGSTALVTTRRSPGSKPPTVRSPAFALNERRKTQDGACSHAIHRSAREIRRSRAWTASARLMGESGTSWSPSTLLTT